MDTGRKKIGILFNYSEGWIGGSYYFINLVYALKQLNDIEKPHIVIVSESNAALNVIEETGYPYLSYLSSKFHYNIVERVLNKISKILFKTQLIKKSFPVNTIDVLFGYYEQLFMYEKCRKIYWIPDLQDKYYPQYLGVDVAKSRKLQHEKLAYSNSEVLFSSHDSKEDFEKFYPKSICKKDVVQFAVTLPNYNNININDVLLKYNINQPYFISPNQFWSHKNHITVIKAVELLKQKGISINVIFTGNEQTGGGGYANELKEYVTNAGLQNNCQFLGFIDRKEQLILMKHSRAVVQPSLFEGWSTVVEDAKCMGKYLILSDLKVHHEQLDKNVSFFTPQNFTQLASILEIFTIADIEIKNINYDNNLRAFADAFIKLINNAKNNY
jgi:glycosyltransferase involved in cell wall biosynthesis